MLILTPWRQFARLDLQRLHSVMKEPIIFDGRNLFAPEEMAAAGFVYHSVGRLSSLLRTPVASQLGMPTAAGYTVARIAAAAEQPIAEAQSPIAIRPGIHNEQSPGTPQRATGR